MRLPAFCFDSSSVSYRRQWLMALRCFLMSIATSAHGQQVTLAWDRAETDDTYRVYMARDSAMHTSMVADADTNTFFAVSGLATGQWWAAVSSVRGGSEGPACEPITFEVPSVPENMRVLAIEATADLSAGSWTNFFFLRLRLK